MIKEVEGERAKYKTFSIEQTGRGWKVVSRDRPRVYGGGLVFEIDKCTGGVMHAQFFE